MVSDLALVLDKSIPLVQPQDQPLPPAIKEKKKRNRKNDYQSEQLKENVEPSPSIEL